MKRLSTESALQQVQERLAQFPLLDKYLTPSLAKRFMNDYWYENRIVRYVFRDPSWLRDLENTFNEAQLDTVPNSEEIFDVLQGIEPDYDEKLFDALVEVRLAAWARSKGYQKVEKLKAIGPAHPSRTPDFLMCRRGYLALAEAKHFRLRDYLLYFIEDHLKGLALKTGRLADFGLDVETADKYTRTRDDILANRLDWHDWMEAARNELTEDWLIRSEQVLMGNRPVPIMDGLFVIERSDIAAAGGISSGLTGMLDPKGTTMLFLLKLQCDLMDKLKQIREFIDAIGTPTNQVIVFFSGVDEWQPEWSELWMTLEGGQEQWAWDYVDQMKKDADALIGMPFELIIGRYQKKGRGPEGELQYGPIEYRPFPWRPPGP